MIMNCWSNNKIIRTKLPRNLMVVYLSSYMHFVSRGILCIRLIILICVYVMLVTQWTTKYIRHKSIFILQTLAKYLRWLHNIRNRLLTVCSTFGSNNIKLSLSIRCTIVSINLWILIVSHCNNNLKT